MAALRSPAALVVAAALLHLVLALLALQPAPYSGGDNATYVGLARSILERGSYTEIWDPAERPATLYPPVFPLLLAALIAAGASSWLALKVALACVSAAAVAVSTLYLLRTTTRGAAAACALFLAVLPGILAQTHTVLSEIPFWALVMVALWAFARYEAEDAAHPLRWLALAAVAGALAWLTRSAGVALAGALLVRLLLLRRWRDTALLAAIVLVPAALWWLRGRLLAPHGYGEYLLLADPYRPEAGRIGVLELVPRALENAATYFLALGPRFLAGGPELGRALAPLIILLAMGGWLGRVVRRRGALELWVLFYGGLILIWPQTWAGERFLVPLAPALVFYAVDAVRTLARLFTRTRVALPFAAAALAIVVVAPGTENTVRLGIECRSWPEGDQAFPCTQAGWRELFEVALLTRGRLPEDAVVISRKPTLFWELSGYRSTTYPWSDDPDVFFGIADSVGAEYVVLDRSPETSQMYLVPVLEAYPQVFCVIEELSRERAVMLRIDFDGATPLPQDGAPGQVRFRVCEAIS